MTKARVALAGLGNAAQTLHLPALVGLAEVELVGGIDPNEVSRAKVAESYQLPTYGDLESLLAVARPDVLVVATPPTTHKQVCLQAIAAGLDVIVEKPLAPSVADAEAIVEAARSHGRQLALNHEFREMPAFRAVLDQIRAEGPPVFAQAWQNMDLPPWAEPGWRGQLVNGVLYEAGIHLVDYLLAAFGEAPRAVSAIMSACGQRDEASDALALVTMEFSKGRMAHVTQNRFCKGETQYFEARIDTVKRSHRVSYGGRLRASAGFFRSTRPHFRIENGRSGIAWAESGHHRQSTGSNPANAPMVATQRLLAATLSAFRSGGASAAPAPAAAGLDSLRTLAAAYISAASGRRIDLRTDDALIRAHRFE
jgi:predicted dehydrogenase